MTRPQGCDGLSARRMTVLWTFCALSLCRHVRRELLRNAWLDFTPIIPATACHQRNYVETYSRCKGLVQCAVVLDEAIRNQIARLKWSLWHGQVDKALGKIDDLASSIAPFSETYARFTPLRKALSVLRTYIGNNRDLIPNYGQRYHQGEAIATSFVESTVNEVVSKRFCKKQQMQWSKKGAHLLLQTRVKTLDGELGAVFKRWYSDMDIEVDEMPAAA